MFCHSCSCSSMVRRSLTCSRLQQTDAESVWKLHVEIRVHSSEKHVLASCGWVACNACRMTGVAQQSGRAMALCAATACSLLLGHGLLVGLKWPVVRSSPSYGGSIQYCCDAAACQGCMLYAARSIHGLATADHACGGSSLVAQPSLLGCRQHLGVRSEFVHARMPPNCWVCLVAAAHSVLLIWCCVASAVAA